VLLIPNNNKLDSVDGIILPDKLLQFTIKSKGHPIAATRNFVQFLGKMRTFCLNNGILQPNADEKVGYFFVVPHFCYDKLTPQSVLNNETGPDDQEKKNLVQTVYNKTVQYVVNVNLRHMSILTGGVQVCTPYIFN
jgi:hypothetical protein